MSEHDTPLMRQYRRIKSELPPGVILFFRLGDFYEMFYEDAQVAAPVLDITLTRRQGMPMCGVPYHSVDAYLCRLIKAGHKVALCDQMEDPATARGIVRREVTRIVTPGTVVEEGILDSGRQNYLAGIARVDGVYGLALLDLSTGEFWGETRATPDALRDAVARHAPSECAAPAPLAESAELEAVRRAVPGMGVTGCDEWTFDAEPARDCLTRHFGVRSLEGFGCEHEPAIVAAAGGVLAYVRDALRRQVSHVRGFRVRRSDDYMLLDENTCRNLDLVPARGRETAASLLGVLDVTRTPMGARLLRDWLLRPLIRCDAILERQDAVGALVADRLMLAELREALGGVRDMERLIARIGAGAGNARDMVGMGQSLAALPSVRAVLEPSEHPGLRTLAGQIALLPELSDLIGRALVEDPPLSLKEGGVIRAGYNADLDAFRSAATDGRSWLAEYQASEQQRTGIKTLKVRHNKVFGYYIEVSRGQLAHVPPEYVRRQTLVNAERFITDELKVYENKVFGAHDKAVAIEQDLFQGVREAVLKETAAIQQSAAAISRIDALASLADRALALRYVRPEINDSDRLHIRGGRHPVVEQMPEAERFVPNDALLDGRDNQLIIITGPNMAGKSTYIRQVGLLVIMAQTGSYVPAESAEVGIVDRVFTRVGASDDLARGRSTFMVEMEETANILNNATARSLIVLDEIGRGTSTFDGISIAWAVAEYLHNSPRVKARTLFATHYHELTDLALAMKGVKNYNVLAREQGDRVVFLRKIVPGGADKSYGIQVARLAGLPDEVIERAREILGNLEEGEFGESGQPKIARRRQRRGAVPPSQLSLFE
jgi:DNA mismatch repair protein MutS